MRLICQAAAIAIAVALGAAAQDKPKESITISVPEQAIGTQVGCSLAIEGTAALPGGQHLWVFVRRADFEGVWWPQGEGKVDPKTLKWSVPVTFGQQQDVGMDFDIAVVAVTESEHIKLRDYRIKAMTTDNWLPIEMPATAAPPLYRTVRKVNHSNCRQ
jgi:hypothetical protein